MDLENTLLIAPDTKTVGVKFKKRETEKARRFATFINDKPDEEGVVTTPLLNSSAKEKPQKVSENHIQKITTLVNINKTIRKIKDKSSGKLSKTNRKSRVKLEDLEESNRMEQELLAKCIHFIDSYKTLKEKNKVDWHALLGIFLNLVKHSQTSLVLLRRVYDSLLIQNDKIGELKTQLGRVEKKIQSELEERPTRPTFLLKGHPLYKNALESVQHRIDIIPFNNIQETIFSSRSSSQQQ